MTEPAATVLLIEDEPQIRRFLRVVLTSHGYRLIESGSGKQGISLVASEKPDVVILDLGLPDMDGLKVTTQLREWTTVPIVVLSAREQERDKVEALDAGADDYLTKPFGVDELLARLRVALRHARRSRENDRSEAVFVLGHLKVDQPHRRVLVRDKETHLTPIEYKLLTALVRNAGKVVTHRQLLQEVWGKQYSTESRYLRVYMGMLRHKLEDDPARPQYLITEPGVGYRLRIDD
jgi:two-component system KDP operon response regulator KdpE